MPNIALTEAEREALAQVLRDSIKAEPFPLSLRVRILKAMLEKVDPAAAAHPAPAPPIPDEQPDARLRRSACR